MLCAGVSVQVNAVSSTFSVTDHKYVLLIYCGILSFLILRLRVIMIGRHFYANVKVQTAMCKDNNNSKGR